MTTAEMVERLKGNPKTTVAGIICGALYALGDYLHSGGIEPWGGLALGAAAVVGVVGLFLARDGAKPATVTPLVVAPPPSEPPAPPAAG